MRPKLPYMPNAEYMTSPVRRLNAALYNAQHALCGFAEERNDEDDHKKANEAAQAAINTLCDLAREARAEHAKRFERFRHGIEPPRCDACGARPRPGRLDEYDRPIDERWRFKETEFGIRHYWHGHCSHPVDSEPCHDSGVKYPAE